MANLTVVRNRGRRAVLVGVDGSVSAHGALSWAAGEASYRRCPLRIVHAFSSPLIGNPIDMTFVGPVNDDVRSAAEWIVSEAENHARQLAPGIRITGELFVAGAAPMLLREARDAELVVVGSRGLGGFHGLLVGSASAAVAAHAPCPVIVVRPRPDGRAFPATPTGRIVVGVDGSDVSTAAIRFALQEAARRHVGVTAVHAVIPPHRHHRPTRVAEGIDQQLFAESLDRMRVVGVDLQTRVLHADPAQALIEESAGAGLVVVGSDGHAGLGGLGSVSRAVLHRSVCPVAVVRPRRTTSVNSLPSHGPKLQLTTYEFSPGLHNVP
jgi:nucleotide-binding universal stress UspA family protein